ncbi:MAG: methyltransferase domain-containing protein [Chloroflexota bacterium]
MADTDRERWNFRYAERHAERPYLFEPTSWLPEIADQLVPPHPGARALDLACGPGRNAVWLAERGWTVDAWELSDVALDILRREIERRAAAGSPLHVTPRQIDLDAAELPPETYALILNVLFLDRRLWPGMARALVSGGLLVFETFVHHPLGRQSEVSPEHLLQPGELRAAFEALGLQTVSYDELAARGTARLLARRAM